ncbi:MAG: serine hydrolase, partial [Bacteroidetes bacterium]|nr:serine hydrolase [Bacteroidota bacterium]
MKKLLFLLLISSSFAFGQSDTSMYFPPINNSEWATIAPESLNWN